RKGGGTLARFLNDLRHARRTLARRPVFAAAAVLTLAVGVGATTAIFTVAHAVLLTPLSYPRPERLVFLSSGFPGAPTGGDQLSYSDVREIAERNRTLDSVASYNTSFTLHMRGRPGGDPERVRANIVGPSYLSLLGARAARGRLLGADDDRAPNGHPVVVITE